jgi:hypothetical protein
MKQEILLRLLIKNMVTCTLSRSVDAQHLQGYAWCYAVSSSVKNVSILDPEQVKMAVNDKSHTVTEWRILLPKKRNKNRQVVQDSPKSINTVLLFGEYYTRSGSLLASRITE